MKFQDPCHPESPTLEEQADALRKGLGRAMIWACSGKLDDGPLLHACLHDQRHDMQVEETRGSWLWQLVQTVGGENRFRTSLLEELQRLPDERNVYQLCELACHYAAMGENEFRRRLYEIVEHQPVPDAARLGEKEILKLDGADAFVFIAGIRGRRLESRDWDWDDDSLVSDANCQLGEDQVTNLLENTKDRSVQRFFNTWLDQKEKNADPQSKTDYAQQIQSISVHEIISEAESERRAVGRFRGWGMQASEEDLNTILDALWSAEDPRVISSYLRVFSNRVLPAFDARMIAFCKHSDQQVRHWAFHALKLNSHPLIREFACSNSQHGISDHYFSGLWVRNYLPGDENLILEALVLPDEPNERHWLLADMIELMQKNKDADPSKLALVVYAHTPCENCRLDAVKLLQSCNAAPNWLAEECRFDSFKECRKLFQDHSPRTSTGDK